MRIFPVQRPLSALHVWAFVPVPLGTSQELMHSVEHRIFLDSGIAALEDPTVRHNGMTFWSGIRLEFTIPPQRFDDLRLAIERLFKNPLPKMSFEERERLARELEEGGGDLFDRAIDRFRAAFSEANDLKHSGKDEDAIWKGLDFSAVRLLSVGNMDDFARAHPLSASWEEEGRPIWFPSDRTDLVFPVLKEELAESEDERYETSDDARFEYVLIFSSIVKNSEDFAFHSLFCQHIRMKTDTEFRDTGRTYDPISEDYFEDGFAVSGIHLITSDTSRKLPSLPKKPSLAEFERTRSSLAFQNSIYLDQLLYGPFSVLGLSPEEAVRSIAEFSYEAFRERFDHAVGRISIFWGLGE